MWVFRGHDGLATQFPCNRGSVPCGRGRLRGMDHQPGDIVNGHVLGSDLVWHPVQEGPQLASLGARTYAAYVRDPGGQAWRSSAGYWGRFSRRWWKSFLGVWAVTSALLLVGALVNPGRYPFGLIDVAVGGFCWAVGFGLPLAFVVAAFPSKR